MSDTRVAADSSRAESSIESRDTSLEARGVECNWGRYGLKRCAANGNLEQCTTTSMTTISMSDIGLCGLDVCILILQNGSRSSVPRVARAPGAWRCVPSSSDYPWLRCRGGSSIKCTSDYPLE